MFGFDKMFDFNRNGRLDTFERAAQFQFMDEMMKHEETDSFDDDNEEDGMPRTFANTVKLRIRKNASTPKANRQMRVILRMVLMALRF